MESLGYFAILLAGLSLGLIGGGGSILTVPILVYLFGISPVLATGYSLLIVGVTSAVGALSYAKQGLLKLKTGLLFGVPSVFGVSIARAFLVPALPDPVFEIKAYAVSKDDFLMIAFSILMMAAAIAMLRSKKQNDSGNQGTATGKKRFVLVGLLGFGVGCLTGFLGAGGGFLIVPALALILNLSMKVAIGTSLFIIALSSLVGFAVDVFQQGSIQVGFLALISFISILGVGAGIWLANHISNHHLKKGFGWLVFLVGVAIVIEQLTKLI